MEAIGDDAPVPRVPSRDGTRDGTLSCQRSNRELVVVEIRARRVASHRSKSSERERPRAASGRVRTAELRRAISSNCKRPRGRARELVERAARRRVRDLDDQVSAPERLLARACVARFCRGRSRLATRSERIASGSSSGDERPRFASRAASARTSNVASKRRVPDEVDELLGGDGIERRARARALRPGAARARSSPGWRPPGSEGPRRRPPRGTRSTRSG